MGKTDTGKNREILHKRIARLKASAVEIKQGRYVYMGSLIEEAYKDEETQKWVIVLNKKLRVLYAGDQFTYVDWTVRNSLSGKPLAQWLHGFYASHAKPFPLKVETLLNLSGSGDANPRSAKQTLCKALDAVTEASTTHGVPFSYEIQSGLVHVQKQAKKESKPGGK